MEKRIVTLTVNPALDKISGVENVNPDKKMRCNQPNHEPGGGGINVSRAIHRLGGQSLAIYPCGGPNGEKMKRLINEEGLQQEPFPIKDEIRENLTVFESSSTHQYRFIMPGPKLQDKEIEEMLDLLKDLDPKPKYLVASGSLPLGAPDDLYQRIVEVANDLDCRVIVDTSGKPLKMASKAGVFLLKPNMRELGNLAGSAIESEAYQIKAAKALVDQGKAQVVVVSLGAGGALLVTDSESEHLRTPTVPIRSKLGAGDSMVAGMVVRLIQGEEIRDAVMYGIAAGAATVMTPGTDLCSKKNTDKLYERLVSKK